MTTGQHPRKRGEPRHTADLFWRDMGPYRTNRAQKRSGFQQHYPRFTKKGWKP